MATETYIRGLAKKYENEANKIKDILSRKSKTTSSGLIEALEKAAYFRRMVGETDLAKANYREAMKYGSKKTMSEIENKYKKIYRLNLQPQKPKSLIGRIIEEFKFNKLFAFLSIITLLFALFFVSLSFTGNIILGLTKNNSRWIGLCLFVCGLFFTFLYFRKRK